MKLTPLNPHVAGHLKVFIYAGFACLSLFGCGKKTATKEEISQRTSAYSTRLPSTGTKENAVPSQASSQIVDAVCFSDKNMLRWKSTTTSAINYQIQLMRGQAVFSYIIYCENQDHCKPTMNGQSIEPNAYVSTQATGDSREFEFSDNRAGFTENYGYRYYISAFSQTRGIFGQPVQVPECSQKVEDQ